MLYEVNDPVVLHVVTALDFGGVESQMLLIGENKRHTRYAHSFCALQSGGGIESSLRELNAQMVILNLDARIPSLAAVWRLLRLVRRLRPRVLHLHGAEANFHGAIVGRLAAVPVTIAEEIGIPQHSPKARRVFRHVYRQCDAVVAVSEAVKSSIVELGEAEPEQITTIYNPVALQAFRAFPPLEGVLHLGFVGRLEAVKNPIAAVESVALLRERGRNVTLRIVGEGSQRPMLESRVAALGLEGKVELTGFHPRPFELLRDCHLYLQPSLTEGFGLAICEAMSAGIPVIASAVGGAPEIIEHGVTGWLLDRPDANSLADMIELVAQSPSEDLAAFGERASKTITDRFAPEIYLQRCEDLYDQLLHRVKQKAAYV